MCYARRSPLHISTFGCTNNSSWPPIFIKPSTGFHKRFEHMCEVRLLLLNSFRLLYLISSIWTRPHTLHLFCAIGVIIYRSYWVVSESKNIHFSTNKILWVVFIRTQNGTLLSYYVLVIWEIKFEKINLRQHVCQIVVIGNVPESAWKSDWNYIEMIHFM